MQAEIMKQYNSDVKPVLQEFSQDTLGVEAGVAAAITADQYSTLPPAPPTWRLNTAVLSSPLSISPDQPCEVWSLVESSYFLSI